MARTSFDRPSSSEFASATDRRAVRSLVIFVIVGVGLAIALWRISGPPTFHSGSDLGELSGTLRGSTLSDGQLIAAGAAVAWGVLGYLALISALRATLIAAVRMTGGARWARSALRFSRLITVPAVRRLVDGGVAGALLLSSSMVAPARALAFAPGDAWVALAPPVATAAIDLREVTAGREPRQEIARTVIEYTVQPGDSLWEIARRFYGDGTRYVDIFDASRSQATLAARLTDPRFIEPGWVLAIPLPARNFVVNEAAAYRVMAGDDLWSIAARLLGDGFRWTELFDANRGQVMPDGRRFTDPSLIYPGWILALPHITVADVPAPTVPSRGTPTPEPRSTATSTAAPVPEPSTARAEWSWPTLPREIGVTAAGFVVLGGVALFVQRLRRSGAITFGRRRTAESAIGDAGRVALAGNALSTALCDLGLHDARLVAVDESSRGLACLVACPAADSVLLIEQREALERRLACTVRIREDSRDLVTIVLSDFNRFAASVLMDSTEQSAFLVPVGADDDAIAYMNVAAGAVGLSVDAPEQRRLLRAWIATLTTTHTPDELALRADTATAELLDDLIEAPHFAGVAGTNDAVSLAGELDAIVQLRLEEGANRTPIIAVLTATSASVAGLHEVIRVGATVGVFIIAITDVADLALFPTTVRATDALQSVPDDVEASVAIGALLLRMEDAFERRLEPVQVRRDTSPRWRDAVRTDVPAPDHAPAASLALLANPDADELCGDDGGPDASPACATPAAFGHDPDSAHADGVLSTARSVEVASSMHAANAAAGRSTAPVAVAERPPLPEPQHVEAARAGVQTLAAVSRSDEAQQLSDGSSLGARQLAMFVGDVLGDDEDLAAPFTVRCFGEFEVETGGKRVTSWTYQKASELLAFLVTQGSPISGERVAEALWPGIEWDASLRHNLRNITARLRATLRDAAGRPDLRILESSRQSRLEFESHLFTVDIEEFELSLRRAASAPSLEALDEYDRAFAQYRGDFLAGQPFSWAEPFRVEFRRRLLEGTHRAAEIAVRLGARDRAADYYRLALTHYAVDEVAARGYMRVLADSGDINGARKAYRVLSEAIQQELEDPRAGPDPETRGLLAQLTEEARRA
ncbi:MAG: LysM peptidoglycan-binding domain-containing protein [Dehalococcoidia bacterium]|nr:MAG: LysM peptidoglycan-binding domain-containing protein [Dehalococcoidia bacterium]